MERHVPEGGQMEAYVFSLYGFSTIAQLTAALIADGARTVTVTVSR